MKKHHLSENDIRAIVHDLPSLTTNYKAALLHVTTCEVCHKLIDIKKQRFKMKLKQKQKPTFDNDEISDVFPVRFAQRVNQMFKKSEQCVSQPNNHIATQKFFSWDQTDTFKTIVVLCGTIMLVALMFSI